MLPLPALAAADQGIETDDVRRHRHLFHLGEQNQGHLIRSEVRTPTVNLSHGQDFGRPTSIWRCRFFSSLQADTSFNKSKIIDLPVGIYLITTCSTTSMVAVRRRFNMAMGQLICAPWLSTQNLCFYRCSFPTNSGPSLLRLFFAISRWFSKMFQDLLILGRCQWAQFAQQNIVGLVGACHWLAFSQALNTALKLITLDAWNGGNWHWGVNIQGWNEVRGCSHWNSWDLCTFIPNMV